MAKQENISPEELEKQRREKEKKDKEEREKKELEKKRKEKEAKLKRIQKRVKQKEKEEIKRIKTIVEFPFKTLFQVSSLITSLFFIVVFFGKGEELYKAVYNSFIVFTALYLGLGIVLVAIFLVMSERKEKELEAELEAIMAERKAEEDKKIKEMQDMENEIKAAASSSKSIHNPEPIAFNIEELQAGAMDNMNQLPGNDHEFADAEDGEIFDEEPFDGQNDDYADLLSDMNK
jgi:uncharacterized membrane protein YcjF (UPF0283 family)